MSWKEQLSYLEKSKKWDDAIIFMESVIQKKSNDMDAYIAMNYLIINLLVEEEFDINKHDYYASLARKYFEESYAKFSHNAEYLYFTGITAVMSEWYFGIEVKDYELMIDKAIKLDPNNLLYNFNYYWELFENDRENQEAIAYAKMFLDENSKIQKFLKIKGSIGAYLLEIKGRICEEILGIRPYWSGAQFKK